MNYRVDKYWGWEYIVGIDDEPDAGTKKGEKKMKLLGRMPAGITPIHGVTNTRKVAALLRAAIAGDDIRPYIIDGVDGNGNLITGTHRAVVNDILEAAGFRRLIMTITLDDAMEALTAEARYDVGKMVDMGDFSRINDFFDVA
ncbi:MAG: hypothetical protein AAB956_01750 [Patescibacteria group bacterium]